MKKISVFKLTLSDWYPSYCLNGKDKRFPTSKLVRISFLKLSNGLFRVCAWGLDDFGLEKDFATKYGARKVFDKILTWETVEPSALKILGFQNA